jgi:hypothetical protein
MTMQRNRTGKLPLLGYSSGCQQYISNIQDKPVFFSQTSPV